MKVLGEHANDMLRQIVIAKESSQIGELKVETEKELNAITAQIAKESSQIGELKEIINQLIITVLLNRKREFSDRRIESKD